MSLKNSNDIIRNRNRDLPVCSVQPPRAPVKFRSIYNIYIYICVYIYIYTYQRCTNEWCQFIVTNAFGTVASNNYRSSVWSLLHVTRFVSRVLRLVLVFLEDLCTPGVCMIANNDKRDRGHLSGLT
jgi:hypothetical protein